VIVDEYGDEYPLKDLLPAIAVVAPTLLNNHVSDILADMHSDILQNMIEKNSMQFGEWLKGEILTKLDDDIGFEFGVVESATAILDAHRAAL